MIVFHFVQFVLVLAFAAGILFLFLVGIREVSNAGTRRRVRGKIHGANPFEDKTFTEILNHLCNDLDAESAAAYLIQNQRVHRIAVRIARGNRKKIVRTARDSELNVPNVVELLRMHGLHVARIPVRRKDRFLFLPSPGIAAFRFEIRDATFLIVCLSRGLGRLPDLESLEVLRKKMEQSVLSCGTALSLIGTTKEEFGIVNQTIRNETLRQSLVSVRNEMRARELAVLRIAHDVRIPVTSLRLINANLNTEIAKTEIPLEMKTRTGLLLNRLTRQLQNLELIVNNLLSLETGKRETSDLESIDFGATWLSLLDGHAEEFKKKEIKVRLESDAIGLMILTESAPLIRILENLISNALKFCNPGGTVWTSVRLEAAQCVLDFEDSGPGLSPSDEDIHFKFARKNLGRGGTGFGLGLALARELAIEIGGSLSLVAPKNGRGARFLLVLPVRRTAMES